MRWVVLVDALCCAGQKVMIVFLKRCYTRQFFMQLVSQFCCAIVTQVAWIIASAVTCPELNMPDKVFVAVTIAQSRTIFCFSRQFQQQQKNWETCSTGSFQVMLQCRQQLVQLVSQQNCEARYKKNCLVKQCL